MDRAIDRDAAIAAALQDIEDFAVEIAEKHELPVGWDSKKVLKHLRALPALSTLPVAGDGRIHEAVSTVGDLLPVVLKRNQGMYIGDKDDIRAALAVCDAARALATDAGEALCEDQSTPGVGDICRACGYNKKASGIDGGKWVHMRCNGQRELTRGSTYEHGTLVARTFTRCPGCAMCDPSARALAAKKGRT